ncbi:MAG: ABC transporter permease [Acidobacteriota bacterium]|nr:ABC transporter permease [Blastocatellia bacterium]MDW8411111.1 ABC transporter permease [Acidobacteriota bacterium]
MQLWKDVLKTLKHNRLVVVAASFLALMSVIVTVGPMFVSYSFDEINLDATNEPPSLKHWFGTDPLGRDIFVRTLIGGRISLMVGLIATAVSFIIGVTYGAISGYLGGHVDELMMRFVDLLYSLPHLFLVICFLAFFSKDLLILFVALGAISWLTMARIVRGQVLSIKQQEYVEAARACGTSSAKIIVRHILPNALVPVIAYTTLTVPSAILSEAFLSFLGLGVQPPLASWGTLLSDGIISISVYPWQLICPAAMMTATLFSLNVLGDGLIEALNPRKR